MIQNILKESKHGLSQFSKEKIDDLEKRIISKTDKKRQYHFYIKCLVRKKEIRLTREEIIRQLYLLVLHQDFEYPLERMQCEYPVNFGREKKRADIVIFDKDKPKNPYIIIEVKKPKLKEGKDQLKSYCNATGAPIAVWTNGEEISFYQRKDPNYFENLSKIPKATEKLSDILAKPWTWENLKKEDHLVKENKSLKSLILEMEDEVLANAGVDVFEECFKLIFTKLYDELLSGRDQERNLQFRNSGDTETELKNKIQNLFDKAKEEWQGVFSLDEKIQLSDSHLSICVASLQNVKLFNSNLDVVDEAFEYLMNKSSKGEKGQYFTPRYVIDMCVKMLNPQKQETIIDTAAGSCGFPVHTMFYIWEQILQEKGLSKSPIFTTEKKPPECKYYVKEKVFGIEFDKRAVRVARTLNLIAGDGQTNVLHLNTLDYERWQETQKEEDWNDTYNEGFKKFKKLRKTKNENKYFNFDILMANPPFAGDIKESRIVTQYELGHLRNPKQKEIDEDKSHTKPYYKKSPADRMSRDVLFIERNLNFLKDGGRMAIVLPQGRFNNSSDWFVRNFIAERCRILAVVGLHGNVFKPHTGTKTSVLFLQKWNNDKSSKCYCPKKEDYPIFFATQQEPSKDNSGDKIYVKDENGLEKLDKHEHRIVQHDLFNHNGETQDGIAEAFIAFAKKEKLSFWEGKE